MLHRQHYGKGRALTCFAGDCKGSVHFFYYIIAHRQPKPCSLLFGCVKRIEYFIDILFRYAYAGVLELNGNRAPARKTSHRESTPIWHGVDCIKGKVDEDLRQLVGIGYNLRKV